jgi:hypothetical protein
MSLLARELVRGGLGDAPAVTVRVRPHSADLYRADGLTPSSSSPTFGTAYTWDRVLIAPDGHHPHLTVIELLFGADWVDFAMVRKICRRDTRARPELSERTPDAACNS